MTCSILDSLESIDKGVDIEQVLKTFIEQNKQNRIFNDISKTETKDKIWNILRDNLNQQNEALYDVCLRTICILSRDKSMVNSIVVDENFVDTLLRLACLKDDDDNLLKHSAVVVEALKCLYNLVFNSTKVQFICSKNKAADGIVRRIRTYPNSNIPIETKSFDMKLLFLITAFIPETRSHLKNELHAVTYLTEVLNFILSDGNKYTGPYVVDEQHLKLSSEILKVMFNLTLKDTNVEDQVPFSRLVTIMKDLLIFSQPSSMHDLISRDIINLLTNIPGEYLELLLSEQELENNKKAIRIILSFLERQLLENSEHKLNETLCPTLVLLISACRQHKLIRRTVREIVLPPLKLKDVKHLPEEGNSLRSRLCKLLTSVHIQLRDLVATFLFVLCKENVNRMIKYTGFGNAAGMLAQRGLLSANNKSVVYSSESEESETEEYTKVKDSINHITGRVEPPLENPWTSMSEEQKEYEAMKLVNTIDQLERNGLIKPCVIGEDGKPRPIDHILELQNEHKNMC